LQQTYMLFLGVAIIGIPHGSIDHYLYMTNNKLSGSFIHFIKFLIQYIGIGLIYAALWWLNPLIALFIFICISAFHFGELDTLNFDFKTKKYAYLIALTYGLLFLLNLLPNL
jgi:Brp/Blh family beta-carotene 15,15'-monooxygenase